MWFELGLGLGFELALRSATCGDLPRLGGMAWLGLGLGFELGLG